VARNEQDNGYRFARDYIDVGVVGGGRKRKFDGKNDVVPGPH
jgi:hypothetical protein